VGCPTLETRPAEVFGRDESGRSVTVELEWWYYGKPHLRVGDGTRRVAPRWRLAMRAV
jgi:hypothetical protein